VEYLSLAVALTLTKPECQWFYSHSVLAKEVPDPRNRIESASRRFYTPTMEIWVGTSSLLITIQLNRQSKERRTIPDCRYRGCYIENLNEESVHSDRNVVGATFLLSPQATT
jgi:hypothetical protein